MSRYVKFEETVKTRFSAKIKVRSYEASLGWQKQKTTYEISTPSVEGGEERREVSIEKRDSGRGRVKNED